MKLDLQREEFLSLEIILRHQQIKRNRLWAVDRNNAEDPGEARWVYERKFVTGKRSYMVILSILNIFAVNISKTLKCCSLVLVPTHQICFSSRTRNPYQAVGKRQTCSWEKRQQPNPYCVVFSHGVSDFPWEYNSNIDINEYCFSLDKLLFHSPVSSTFSEVIFSSSFIPISLICINLQLVFPLPVNISGQILPG